MRRSESPSRRRELARELSRGLDVCREAELYCALAMDVAAAHPEVPDQERVRDVLRNCTMVCAAAAGAIASLRTPDLEQVAHALVACGLACGVARAECERGPFRESSAECAAVCGECANVCASLLARRAPRASGGPRTGTRRSALRSAGSP